MALSEPAVNEVSNAVVKVAAEWTDAFGIESVGDWMRSLGSVRVTIKNDERRVVDELGHVHLETSEAEIDVPLLTYMLMRGQLGASRELVCGILLKLKSYLCFRSNG